ncbi:related to Putative DNA repair protein [Cephalotrichum gorgonifer]|uniref:Related to Putative DNA repair protein n=1 Tax=Cephalotrichum gorgonifer TaxID=2041049 RepID=A0AAE8N002_9PEZI|nr:related to Putative DNA repair protein [Cephalotrichum gorgonifer]
MAIHRPILRPSLSLLRAAKISTNGTIPATCCNSAVATEGAAALGHVTSSGFRVETNIKAGGLRRQSGFGGMFRRYAFGLPPGRQLSTMSSSTTPIEDAIRSKVTAALQPTTLEVYNDSQLHAHHKAMVGQTSKETHFRLVIISDAFKSKMQNARHRMIYALLRDEMSQAGGIHALQLRTLTPEEDEKHKNKAKEEREQKEQQQPDGQEKEPQHES